MKLKQIFYLLTLALFVVLWSYSVSASQFIEGIDDVPIMEDMEQLHANNVSFGNNDIRFVEAYFSDKKAKFSQVAQFYQETLPQLGWKFIEKRKNHLTFERDSETLDIVEENKSPLLVRITLKSKN